MVMDGGVLRYPARAPGEGRTLVSSRVLATLMFVFAETMLFAGMISAHMIVRARWLGEMWPPLDQPLLPVQATAVNTGMLLLSGILLLLAGLIFRAEPARAGRLLLISFLLGGYFVAAQGVEWVALIREGLTLRSSAYGSFFYLIVGTHALHAVAALCFMGWAWLRLHRGRLSADQFGAVQVFWYFVVLIWPFLYLRVYLG